MHGVGSAKRLSRRQVLRVVGGGAAAVTAASVGRQPAWNIIRSRAALAQTGPDVYVVTLDDCSPEYIGFYQNHLPTAYPGPIDTPELDALLAQSWVATSARATVPVCAASRSAFLTGSESVDTGLYGTENLGAGPRLAQFRQKVADGQLVSLPGFLTGSGLDTATRGKVAHTDKLFDIPGQIVHRGTFTDINALLQDPVYAPYGLLGEDNSFMPYGTLPAGTVHVDELRTDEQIARINAAATGQRVDFLGLVMPHTPRAVLASYVQRYPLNDIVLRTSAAEIAADVADIPATHLGYLEQPYIWGGLPRAEWMLAYLTDDQLREHVRHFLATVSHASAQVGRLKMALDAAGRPYVLVLTADHGYHLAEKGHYAKGTLYDQSLRVPLVVYSSEPNPSYPVGVTAKPVSLLGLARSVASLAGFADTSMPAVWKGNRFDDPTNYCTEHTYGGNVSTQSRALVFRAQQSGTNFKVIVHPGDAGEMYNLTADPGEVNNLFAAPPTAGTSAQIAEAEAELELRARKERVRAWRARGSKPTDEQYQ